MNDADIEQMLASKLVQLALDPTGWRKLYRHLETGRFWELDHPRSELHGGGPKRLRELELEDAKDWDGAKEWHDAQEQGRPQD